MFLQVITVVGGMSICFVLSQMQETFERERKKTSSAQLTLPEYLGFVRDDRRRDLGGRGGGAGDGRMVHRESPVARDQASS